MTAYERSFPMAQLGALLSFNCGQKSEYPEKIHLSDLMPINYLTRQCRESNPGCSCERLERLPLSLPKGHTHFQKQPEVQSCYKKTRPVNLMQYQPDVL